MEGYHHSDMVGMDIGALGHYHAYKKGVMETYMQVMTRMSKVCKIGGWDWEHYEVLVGYLARGWKTDG